MPSFPDGVGLAICVPIVGRPVVPEWAFCLMNLHPPMNYNVRWNIVKGKPVDQARNELVQYAIDQKAKYVFFIGDDVTCPAHTVRQLLFNMEHNPKMAVCGAVYCHKAQPNAPMVFQGNGLGPYWDWKVGELFQVSGLGMDATMIRVEALSTIKKPYFRTVDSIADMMEGINKAEAWTEDLYFCKKITDAGWEVWADGALICDHWDAGPPGKKYTLAPNSKPLRQAAVKYGDKKIVDLGCGPIENSYQTCEGEVLRVDIRAEVNPDYRCDIRNTPFGTGEFDVVFSSHTLEHFPVAEIPKVIEEWIRILKPDGEMRLMLPNLEWAARHILNKEIDKDVMNVIYGAQSYDENFHKMGFTPQIVENLLTTYGFRWYIWDFHGYHMLVRAFRNRPEAWKEGMTMEQAQVALNPVIKLKRDENTPNITIQYVQAEVPKEAVQSLADTVVAMERSTDPTAQDLDELAKDPKRYPIALDEFIERDALQKAAEAPILDQFDVDRPEEHDPGLAPVDPMKQPVTDNQPPARTPEMSEVLSGVTPELK